MKTIGILQIEHWIKAMDETNGVIMIKLHLEYGFGYIRKIGPELYEWVRIGPHGDVKEKSKIGEWNVEKYLNTWQSTPTFNSEKFN